MGRKDDDDSTIQQAAAGRRGARAGPIERVARERRPMDRSGPLSRGVPLRGCGPAAGLAHAPGGSGVAGYRALKEKHSFLELVQTPELAAEVSVQPVRRFGFDAAILFSDILVVSEGLGQPYQFRDGGGIEMEFLLNSPADIDRLEVAAVTERLEYVAKALPLVKSALGSKTALIGFAGSPWTLANFMIEGGGVKEYTKAKALFYSDPPLFGRLMEKLTQAVAAFLQLQIDAGADAVQIFDSLGGVLAEGSFAAASAVLDEANRHRPRGTGAGDCVFQGHCMAIGRTWRPRARRCWAWIGTCAWPRSERVCLPNLGVQGNLDPFLLTTTPDLVAAETSRILGEMRGRPGHIFNLGHGVPPNARLENIDSLVEAVKNYRVDCAIDNAEGPLTPALSPSEGKRGNHRQAGTVAQITDSST